MDKKSPDETDWGVSETNRPKVEKRPYKVEQDPVIFRVALGTISGLSLVGVISFIILALMGIEIPKELNSITSASVGALTGLLIRKNGG